MHVSDHFSASRTEFGSFGSHRARRRSSSNGSDELFAARSIVCSGFDRSQPRHVAFFRSRPEGRQKVDEQASNQPIAASMRSCPFVRCATLPDASNAPPSAMASRFSPFSSFGTNVNWMRRVFTIRLQGARPRKSRFVVGYHLGCPLPQPVVKLYCQRGCAHAFLGRPSRMFNDVRTRAFWGNVQFLAHFDSGIASR